MRPAASYRAARRNTILRGTPKLTWNKHCYYRPQFVKRLGQGKRQPVHISQAHSFK